MKQFDRIVLRAAAALLLTVSLSALDVAQTDQTPPQKVPQAPQDQAKGDTLSSRLDQTNGVIHPPGDVDQGSVRPPPSAGGHSTPVIPPPGSGSGDGNINPK